MKSFLDHVGAVSRKELRDAIRDRRSVLSALLFPLFAPVMIYFMFGAMAARERGADDLVFSVQGGEHAPGLLDWIERAGYEVQKADGDLFEQVREGDLDLAVLVDPDYAEDFAAGRTAQISLISDGANREPSALVRRARRVLQSYSAQTSTLRLIARGVSADMRAPVRLEELDVATSQQRSARMLGFIPLYIILAAFMSGMNVAIDTTAGERERHSLEPLLLNPTSRNAIVAGKWLAGVVFSGVGIVSVLAGILILVPRMDLSALGIRMDVGVFQTVAILAGTVPLAFFAVGIQLVLSTFARSFKEAQTYVSLVMMVAMVPGVIATVSSLPDDPWMVAVPVLGQQMLLTKVLGGDEPGVALFLLAGGSSMLVGVLFVALTARLFQHERIVFGTTN